MSDFWNLGITWHPNSYIIMINFTLREWLWPACWTDDAYLDQTHGLGGGRFIESFILLNCREFAGRLFIFGPKLIANIICSAVGCNMLSSVRNRTFLLMEKMPAVFFFYQFSLNIQYVKVNWFWMIDKLRRVHISAYTNFWPEETVCICIKCVGD